MRGCYEKFYATHLDNIDKNGKIPRYAKHIKTELQRNIKSEKT